MNPNCDIDFESLVLESGTHKAGSGEYCLLEAAACFAGERHTDRPKSVSPVIAAFGRSWNDTLNATDRQMLKPYVFRVLYTNTGPADELRRAWMATDWLVRVFAPTWLALAGLNEQANELRSLPELSSDELAIAAQEAISAARSAARSAAYSAASSAAWSAAWSAASSAACLAAWSAACLAARSAAASAAASAAESAAESAARLAAASAAAESAACLAAASAAYSVLAPTVASLQQEALRLLDRMIAVGKAEPVPA